MVVPRPIPPAAAAVPIGALDAVIFKGFEWLVNHGTDDIWDGLFDTDVHRWRVVPLAAALGAALSVVFLLTGQQRVVPPSTQPLGTGESNECPTVASIATIATIALIGLCSLWAGASLGPEASLVAITGGLGVVGSSARGRPGGKVLELASIGALLVAFVGSLLLVLLPLLVLHRQKQLQRMTAVPVLVAGASAFGTLWLMDRETRGFGRIPADPGFAVTDVVVAVVLGVATAFLGWGLERFIAGANRATRWLDDALPWPMGGALFGLVVGLLYWAGGESVEFQLGRRAVAGQPPWHRDRRHRRRRTGQQAVRPAACREPTGRRPARRMIEGDVVGPAHWPR